MRSELTHVVDAAGRVASMQIDPGRPEEGLRPHFKGRMKSGEFDVPIVLDERGFRLPIISGSEFSGPPFRVTLLGDSFMFGWGSHPDSAFAGNLARDLSRLLRRPVFIRNLSVPGTGQVTQLKLMRESREQEDVIIAGMYLSNHVASGNDLLDNLNERYRGGNVGVASLSVGQREPKVDFLRRLRRKLKQESNLYRLLEARLGSLILAKLSGAMRVREDARLMETAWQIEDSLLVELKNEADRRKAVLILQYFPNMLDFAQESPETYTRLLGFAGRHDIAVAPKSYRTSAAEPSNSNHGRFLLSRRRPLAAANPPDCRRQHGGIDRGAIAAEKRPLKLPKQQGP